MIFHNKEIGSLSTKLLDIGDEQYTGTHKGELRFDLHTPDHSICMNLTQNQIYQLIDHLQSLYPERRQGDRRDH